MKTFLKNSGILLLLIGVLVLAIPFFMGVHTNTSLLTGWILIIAGFIGYIVINKQMP